MVKTVKLSSDLLNEAEILLIFKKKFLAQQRYQHWWMYVSIANRKLQQAVKAGRIDEMSARYFLTKLIPQAMRTFQNILSQGAFISLGFTLIALFSRIYSLLDKLFPQITRSTQKSQLHSLKSVKTGVLPQFEESLDLGEPLEPEDLQTSTSHLGKGATLDTAKPSGGKTAARENHKSSQSKSKSKSKLKSKRKDKGDAIDDIFGF